MVYDLEGATAFFVDAVESRLLDYIGEGKSMEEGVALLSAVYGEEDARKAADHIRSEGLLSEPHIPYQDLPQVYTLTLNATQHCNLRCRYCYVENPGSASFMSEETARKAVDFITNFEDMEAFGVSFYGGEPLLNFPVIKSTIEYATREAERKGFPEVKYHITTNGTLMSDEMIQFFTDYDIDIMVSIDGPAPIHDSMRVFPDGRGTHARVSEVLQKLVEAKGRHKVSVSGVLTTGGRLKDVYKYLSQFPLRDIKLSYVRYLNDQEQRFALSNAQKEEYMEDMRALAVECTNLVMRGVRPPYYNFENKVLQLWKHTKKDYFCPAGLRRFGISPGGEIYPCGPAADLGEFRLGTLDTGLDQTSVERWTAHASFSQRKECSSCWARFMCLGECPLQVLRDRDEKRCEISHHSTRLAIALYTAVKEKNEMMLACFIDEEFLSKIREMIKKKRN